METDGVDQVVGRGGRPDLHDAVAGAGEAARARGADTGARAGDHDRAGLRVGHVVLRKGVVSGHFRRPLRAPVSAKRMNAGGIRAAGAAADHFAKADDVRRRIALSSTFLR